MSDDVRPSKKQKINGTTDDENEERDCCVVCMRNPEELAAAESPMMEHHSCPQCSVTSWNICEECEEHCLSRKCPICRGQYAPIVLHGFPDLQPNAQSNDHVREAKLFKAKMALLLKLVGGSNTAMYLPSENILRFLLPQEFGTRDEDARFLQVDIGDAYNRVIDGSFDFTDKVWDELEAAQAALEEGDGGSPPRGGNRREVSVSGDGSVEYVYVPVESCEERYTVRVGELFQDAEDGGTYRIDSVVRIAGNSSDILFYRYYDHALHGDNPPAEASAFEYTPCDELLGAAWTVWEADRQDWIQCVLCSKWRKLPQRGTAAYPGDLPDDWSCAANTWDDKNSCDKAEDPYDLPTPSHHSDAATVAVAGDGAGGDGGTEADVSLESSAQEGPSDTVAPGSDGTIGLNEAVRRIIYELKNVPGAVLMTRLSPDTTENILRIAMDAT